MHEYCNQYRPDITLLTPQVPCYPLEAKVALLNIIDTYKDEYAIGLVGSSLGGYLSIWLNSLFGFNAVLVNPAIKPYELLQDYLGEQVNPYTNEGYFLEPHHMDELRELDVETIRHPESLWLLQQTEDEVLDYRQAVEKLQGATQTVEEGGDHSFIGFERYPAKIIEFLKL